MRAKAIRVDCLRLSLMGGSKNRHIRIVSDCFCCSFPKITRSKVSFLFPTKQIFFSEVDIAYIFRSVPFCGRDRLDKLTLLNHISLAFEADDEILKQAEQAQIEQFYSISNLTAVDQNDEMTFSSLLYTPEGDHDEFYRTTVNNVKKFAPKLRILHLLGGHTFYPKTSSKNEIRKELIYTKARLTALFRALNEKKIAISSNLITIMIVADDKVS